MPQDCRGTHVSRICPSRTWNRICARLFGLVTIACFATGCGVPTARHDPFLVPPAEFGSSIRIVCLAPIGVGVDVPDRDQVRRSFEDLLGHGLQGASFKLLPSAGYEEIWQRAMISQGGLYDPMTGKLDEHKYADVREATLREVRETLHADAVLFARIAPVESKWSDGIARWDGTTQPVASNAMRFAAFVGMHSNGAVGALSLLIAIQDLNGRDLYENVGGIQVLATVADDWSFRPVAANELLRDPRRNALAVLLATDRLRGPPLALVRDCLVARYRASMTKRTGHTMPSSSEVPEEVLNSFVESNEGHQARLDCDLENFAGVPPPAGE